MDDKLEPLLEEDAPVERGRSLRRPAVEEGSVALLPLYLREMGATPLLEKEQEVELARGLQEAREAMAKLALKLSARLREHVLVADPQGPRRGHQWPLDHLESFYDRLVRHAAANEDDERLARTVREAKRIKRQVDHARDALILSNLRLVAHIAKKYLNHGMSFMDLIQEGNIGLMKAVEKFEYKRGNRFSTYAYWWIKQAIARGIADKARTIRVPVHITEKMKKILRVSAELTDTLGRKPRPQEIARKLRMPVTKVEEILGVVQDAQSLEDFGAGAGEERAGPLRFVADESVPSAYERVLDRELMERVAASLAVLEPREQEIIRLRFGIGRDAPHTLEDIGRAVHLSRERVRQIEETALRKILSADESRILQEHFAAKD